MHIKFSTPYRATSCLITWQFEKGIVVILVSVISSNLGSVNLDIEIMHLKSISACYDTECIICTASLWTAY